LREVLRDFNMCHICPWNNDKRTFFLDSTDSTFLEPQAVKRTPPPGGGYSQKNLVGVCGPLPKTPTLFMTKICDFPYPSYDLTKNLIPYL